MITQDFLIRNQWHRGTGSASQGKLTQRDRVSLPVAQRDRVSLPVQINTEGQGQPPSAN